MEFTEVKMVAATALCLMLALPASSQAVSGPSARSHQSMVYDSRREVVVLFGGYDGIGLGDTWEWDGRDWRPRQSPSAPSPRFHASMAYDSHRGVSVLFGGYTNGGTDQTWEWDGHDWTQAALSQRPSARFYQSMAYDSARQVCVMFGGFDGSTNLGDTWEYDGVAWLQRSSGGPTPRRNHGMAYRGATGHAVLFGGIGSTYLADTWCWDGQAWTQAASSHAPSARSTHAFAYDELNDRIVLFGGYSGRNLDDTWSWDGTDWSVNAPRFRPLARHGITGHLVFDSQRRACVLFGGMQSAQSFLGDTWRFDGSDWRPEFGYSVCPLNGRRYALTPPTSWEDGEGLAALLGGHLATVRNAEENAWIAQNLVSSRTYIGLSDAASEGQWAWSSGENATYTNWASPPDNYGNGQDYATILPNGDWDDVCPFGGCQWPAVIELQGGRSDEVRTTALATTAAPTVVGGFAMARLPRGGALLFGSASGPNAFPITYELMGSEWFRQAPVTSPSAREGHSLILDSARAESLLFGGEDPVATKLGDTWTYVDGQWTHRSTSMAPPARSGHAMAYDAGANVGLLFGGEDTSSTSLADMWSWNGTDWSQLTPAALPPARRGHRMAFDELRGRMVLFGGRDGSTRFDDVWEWDGATWIDVTPTPSGSFSWAPTARDSFAMVYDPRAERVIVHGGETGIGCGDDFWSWDGAQWTRLLPRGAVPSVRHGHAMFHDPAVGEVRMSGGGCTGANDQDLFRIELSVPPRSSIYGSGCAGTAGTPVLDAQPGSRPVLGESFVVDLTGLPFSPASVPFALTGFSKTLWAGGALPVDLTILGMPGCRLLTSSEDTVTLANRFGSASVSLAIPSSPAVLGISLYMQGAVFDRFANPQGIVMSNGLEFRIGDR
jgi:hypothetical protein